jgi:hypothetical protein
VFLISFAFEFYVEYFFVLKNICLFLNPQRLKHFKFGTEHDGFGLILCAVFSYFPNAMLYNYPSYIGYYFRIFKSGFHLTIYKQSDRGNNIFLASSLEKVIEGL